MVESQHKVWHEKQRTKSFFQAERINSVNQRNQILLNKLLDISNGKSLGVITAADAQAMEKQAALASQRSHMRRSFASCGRALVSYSGAGNNLASRKHETERIEKDN